jgi:hypothetical protein
MQLIFQERLYRTPYLFIHPQPYIGVSQADLRGTDWRLTKSMKFFWNAPDNDADSDSSPDVGEPSRRRPGTPKHRKPGRHARFRDDPIQNQFTVPVIPAAPLPMPQFESAPFAGNFFQRSSVPVLTTTSPGNVPVPFNIVPRGNARLGRVPS